MSSSKLDYSSLAALSNQIPTVHTLCFWITSNPGPHSLELIQRVKEGARWLSKACDIQRSRAFECMAAALRFPHWHALNLHLNEGVTFAGGNVPVEWIERLKYGLVLLLEAHRDMSLETGHIAALEDFAERLATEVGCPVELLLDKVCAAYCGEQSWEAVKKRSPLHAKTPLYIFEIDSLDEGSGRFKESRACEQLIEMLDELYSKNTSPQRIMVWLDNTLRHQPEFWYGYLHYSQQLYEQSETYLKDAFRVVDDGLRGVEKLLPQGYRGTIPWTWGSNRFYHRMLWLRLMILFDAGRIRQCLVDARKLLRRNPSDNMGVRFYLPLILMRAGQYEKAAAKVARFSKENSRPDELLIKAFSAFSMGQRENFISNLTKALFDLPILRLFLLDSEEGLQEGDDGFRSVDPATEVLVHFAWPVYVSIPGLQQACKEYLATPVVIRAEKDLWTYWRGFWQKRSGAVGDIDGWYSLKRRLFDDVQTHFIH